MDTLSPDDEKTLLEMIDVFQKFLGGFEYPPEMIYSLLVKFTVAFAVNFDNVDEFLKRMEFCYNMETFLKPTSDEVH